MSGEHITLGITFVKCPKCGCDKSLKRRISDHTEYGLCVNCGAHTYCKILKNLQKINSVKCPYCGSASVKKISTTSKVAYGATFGIFAASKIAHQWHCKNCKSDF